MEQANSQTGKRKSKALLISAALIAVVVAGGMGAKIFYEGKVKDLIARSGATAGSVDVDFLGKVHVRELTLPLEDGKNIRIAAIDGRPKLSFLDGVLEMKDVTIDAPTGQISMAEARVENVAFQRKQGVSDQQRANSLSRRIERFTAKSISTPEMVFTQSTPTLQQKITYKNAALTDVADGRIARYSVETASYDIQMDLPDASGELKKKHVVGSNGMLVGQDIDLAYLARIYSEKAGPDDKEAKPLYGPLSVKSISFSEGDRRFGYDEIRSDGFSVRMPAEPLADTIAALTANKNPNELPPAEQKALLTKALSIFDIFGKSNMQLLGFKADVPDKEEGSTGKRVKGEIDRMDMQMDGRKVDFAMNGMRIGSDNDKIGIDEFSLKGFDWTATAKGLSEIVGLDEAELATFQFQRLIPELGRIRLGGINIDATAPEQPDGATTGTPERIKFSLRNFEMALTKPFNGIPTDVEIRQDDLSLPVPADSSEEIFIEARKLGLDALTFSYGFSAGWDEPSDNLNIRDISLSSKDFGSVNLSGLISGFTQEFFSLDINRAQAALFGLAGREMKLTVKDEGMMAKAIKLYALQNDMTEDQVRGTLSLGVNVILMQIAGEQPKLQNAMEALARFASDPGTLTITAKSTGPNGLGIFDLIAASENPMLLLDKVDIQATAE
ncbi:hypothetical protein ABUK73_12690 [Agrobacterium sp. BA1120]|uniref:hypothetical protein n=1 Tax=Agrobacterium sp. BA1120 TaxID=3228927 RepID=UPI003369CBF5